MKIESKDIYNFVEHEAPKLTGLTGDELFYGKVAAMNFRLQNKKVKEYQESEFTNVKSWVSKLCMFWEVRPEYKMMKDHIINFYALIVFMQREAHKGRDTQNEQRLLIAESDFTEAEINFATKTASDFWN